MLGLIPSHLNQIHTHTYKQYFSNIKKYIILLNWHFSLWNFLRKVLRHATFGYVSNLSYILGDTEWFWHHERKTVLEPCPYTERDKFPVHLNNKGKTLCWQWGSPTHETLLGAYVTSVTQSQTLQTPYYQVVVLYSNSLTLTIQIIT